MPNTHAKINIIGRARARHIVTAHTHESFGEANDWNVRGFYGKMNIFVILRLAMVFFSLQKYYFLHDASNLTIIYRLLPGNKNLRLQPISLKTGGILHTLCGLTLCAMRWMENDTRKCQARFIFQVEFATFGTSLMNMVQSMEPDISEND